MKEKSVLQNVIALHNNQILVSINAIICDAPAKAFITGVKGHTAYFGCSKCIRDGDFFDNRVVYLEIDSELRTGASFKNKSHEDQQLLHFLRTGHRNGNAGTSGLYALDLHRRNETFDKVLDER